MQLPETDYNLNIYPNLLYESKILIIDMRNKRFKDQIVAQILKTCEGGGSNITKVVYASGLNFRTIKPYLVTLDKNELIEIVPGPYPLYKITQKGEDALIHLKALEELIWAH